MNTANSFFKIASRSNCPTKARSLVYLLLTMMSIGIFTISAEAQVKELATDGARKLSYIGALEDFFVPKGMEGHYLFLEAQGGDGGRVNLSTKPATAGCGGIGAGLSAKFMIGNGPHQIPAGARIRFIVGEHGTSHTNDGVNIKHGGGGGGGTGILFLPGDIDPAGAQPEDWTLLIVAGGGGGGYCRFGGRIKHGLAGEVNETPSGHWTGVNNSSNGYEGSDFINGTSDLNRWGGGRYNNAWYGFGGGGSGYQTRSEAKSSYDWAGNGWHPDAPIGDAAYSTREGTGFGRGITGGGFGGFQKVNGIMQPVGQRGGEESQCNNGGYGFGSGGLGMTYAPGAGGGYAGGLGAANASNFWRPAGGGSSYINTTYALPGSIVKNQYGYTSEPKNGHAKYQITAAGAAYLPLETAYTTAQYGPLLQSGNFRLSWQQDGNLVLKENDGSGKYIARWSSRTANQGDQINFQKDGNLVIYDSNKRPIWSSDTWAGKYADGKGAAWLFLSSQGELSILTEDGTVLWSVDKYTVAGE